MGSGQSFLSSSSSPPACGLAVVEMPPWLAAIAALGARSLTSELLRGALILLLTVTGLQVRTVEAVTIVANAAAVLVAFGSARWRGVGAAVALFGVLWLEQKILSIPSVRTFCEHSDPNAWPQICDLTVRAFNSLWPLAAGVAVGLVLRRLVRQGAQGKAVLLIAAGVSGFVFPVVRLLVDPALGVFWHGSLTEDAISVILIIQVIGAVALGGLVGYFGRRLCWMALSSPRTTFCPGSRCPGCGVGTSCRNPSS